MPPAPPLVVVDTNVIVSALISDQRSRLYSNPIRIVRAILEAEDDSPQLLLSEDIWNEYVDVLARFEFEAGPDLLDALHALAHWMEPIESEWELVDPDDEKFMECAAAGDADYLITGNRRHYPNDPWIVTRIVTPAEFCRLELH